MNFFFNFDDFIVNLILFLLQNDDFIGEISKDLENFFRFFSKWWFYRGNFKRLRKFFFATTKKPINMALSEVESPHEYMTLTKVGPPQSECIARFARTFSIGTPRATSPRGCFEGLVRTLNTRPCPKLWPISGPKKHAESLLWLTSQVSLAHTGETSLTDLSDLPARCRVQSAERPVPHKLV